LQEIKVNSDRKESESHTSDLPKSGGQARSHHKLVRVGDYRLHDYSKPKISSKKRGLDDGARNLVAARNAEEARAARKRLKMEKDTEMRVLAKKLADQGLCTVEIPADGHCLFSALSDQLKRTGCSEAHSYKSLRRAAACYMLNNEQHFKSFLALESNSFEQYCKRIEKTSAWGGQHELIALSHYLKRNIQVLRHDMSIQMFPDPATHPAYEGEPLRISYHIHEYSGEHYNSVVSLEEKNKRARAHRPGRTEEPGTDTPASASAPAVKAPKVPKEALTDEQRLKKLSKCNNLNGKKKSLGHRGAYKPPVPWQRGVGGDDARVIVWDMNTKRLIIGNACPTARNIDQYLEKKPWMRIWYGGTVDGEPQPPKRPEMEEAGTSALEAATRAAQAQPYALASTFGTNASEDMRAHEDGHADHTAVRADALGAQDVDNAARSPHWVETVLPLPSLPHKNASDEELPDPKVSAEHEVHAAAHPEDSRQDHCATAYAQSVQDCGATWLEHPGLSVAGAQKEVAVAAAVETVEATPHEASSGAGTSVSSRHMSEAHE
jgi:hypothetical protein